VYEDDFMRFIRLFRGYAKKETEWNDYIH
jgi:hypothetical protein